MLHSGENIVGGIPIDVERKRIRRINIRVASDGRVHLSVPKWWATLKEGEEFLLSKWRWVTKTRAEVLAKPVVVHPPCTEAEMTALRNLLLELNAVWSQKLGEPNVTWKLRKMKSVWGSCHFRRRSITYNAELARVSRAHVEYVVVHELTHLKVPNHGPLFYRLMDERLPGWRRLRRELNKGMAFVV